MREPAGREPAGDAGIGTGLGARPIESAPAALLDALDVGILMLSPALAVIYANARWSEWTGGTVVPATPVRELIGGSQAELLDDLGAVLSSGEPREVMILVRAQVVTAIVRRIASGLLLEARADSDSERYAPLDVTRQLSAVTDMSEVLRTLCDIAIHHCEGSGAAVLRAASQMGEVIAASGDMLPARGSCFELEGSLMAQALSASTLVSEVNFRDSGRPLTRVLPELELGPVLAAPLRAHGDTLGVLVVTRGTGGLQFREREHARLRLLADHAALAVHKSMLLQQAQSADRAKGRFLATMSHELRTPLTALAGYGELLADQVIGPLSESQLDILERMRSVTTHLSAMIEEVLAFTSLEEGREVVRPTEFLAEDLVRAAVAVVEPLATQRKLQLDVQLPTGSIRLSSDIDKARQILVNLLGNAVKFTDRGTVTLALSRRGNAVRIDVSDTGIGIPPEELTRLFRPFSQVDTGLTRRHGGTGLGLYISRRLATLLGGHIEVSSSEGTGSTFSVVLPLVWEARP